MARAGLVAFHPAAGSGTGPPRGHGRTVFSETSSCPFPHTGGGLARAVTLVELFSSEKYPFSVCKGRSLQQNDRDRSSSALQLLVDLSFVADLEKKEQQKIQSLSALAQNGGGRGG